MLAAIDLTITLGNILTTLVTLGAIIISAWRITLLMMDMKWKVDMMWRDFKREHKINGGHNEKE